MNPIRNAQIPDIEILVQKLELDGDPREINYFDRCIDLQAQKLREVFLIIHNGEMGGFCQYNRNSKYQPFKSLKIPEIQDLYIFREMRGQGLATKMIRHCEMLALQEGHDIMGIAVGLHASFGKAQKLYFQLGYEPDGGGIVYDRIAVEAGKSYPVDDDLCLMMIKQLK